MKFRLDKAALNDAVTWATRTLPRNATQPILQGLRITADESGQIQLSTFDYEVSARMVIAAEVESAGDVLVQGRMFADIVHALPKFDVEVSLVGTKVQIICGSSKFELSVLPLEEFPQLPALPPLAGKISADVFAAAAKQVVSSASKDETIPVLTAVRVQYQGNKISFTATDRYRLARRDFEWESENPEAEGSFMIHHNILDKVASSLASGSQISIFFDDSEGSPRLIGFEAGGRSTTSTLIDGEYPRVDGLFPETTAGEVVMKTADLSAAVKRVARVAAQKTPVALTLSEGQIVLEAGSGDEVNAREVLDAQLNGEEIKIGFNAEYFANGLDNLDTEYASLNFTDSIKPTVLTGKAEPQAQADESYRYLIMPMRLL